MRRSAKGVRLGSEGFTAGRRGGGSVMSTTSLTRMMTNSEEVLTHCRAHRGVRAWWSTGLTMGSTDTGGTYKVGRSSALLPCLVGGNKLSCTYIYTPLHH